MESQTPTSRIVRDFENKVDALTKEMHALNLSIKGNFSSIEANQTNAKEKLDEVKKLNHELTDRLREIEHKMLKLEELLNKLEENGKESRSRVIRLEERTSINPASIKEAAAENARNENVRNNLKWILGIFTAVITAIIVGLISNAIKKSDEASISNQDMNEIFRYIREEERRHQQNSGGE